VSGGGARRALWLTLLLSLPLRAAGEFKAHGFVLPGGSVKVDEDRYRLPLGWDEAARFYRNAYPPAKFNRRTLVNQNGIKAMHIDNPKAGPEEWEGANLYETRAGEVRVYVLNHAQPGDGQQ
jgi:hypothetical protein